MKRSEYDKVVMFSAFFVKVLIRGHARSGHQVRSNDTTMQKLYNRATTRYNV